MAENEDRFETTFVWVAGLSLVIALLVLALVWGCAKRNQSSIEPPVNTYPAMV